LKPENLSELPVALIAAMDRKRVIGKDGKMPWHLPEDLTWFKRHTLHNPVLMGRRTYESLPGPLPQRLNIVLSRKASYQVAPDVRLCSNLTDAMHLAGQSYDPAVNKLFVIGGANLFAQLLPRAGYLYLSMIDAEYEGDTWFPDYDPADWSSLHHEWTVSASGTRIDFQILARLTLYP